MHYKVKKINSLIENAMQLNCIYFAIELQNIHAWIRLSLLRPPSFPTIISNSAIDVTVSRRASHSPFILLAIMA